MQHVLEALCFFILVAVCGAVDVVSEVQEFKDKCFETTNAEGGKAATVRKKKLIVWDPDAPCRPGQSFFHYAPTAGAFIPMTAGGGPAAHTYHAAVFTNYNDFGTFVNRCGDTPTGGTEEFSWLVANRNRGGACPAKGPTEEASARSARPGDP